MSIRDLVRQVENQNPELKGSSAWDRLINFVEAEFPELISIRLHTVYKMISKGHMRRMVVTKENSKTWVMYEVEDSYAPGNRWMIGKTWCVEGNLWRDSAQSYLLPAGIKFK